jgi:uncharacterized protein YndB with AHSA1/START domain
VIRHEMSVRLNRPVEQVFAFLVDPEKLTMWQSNLMKAEQLTPGPVRLGSRFREVRRLGRKETEVQAEVSAFERNQRLGTKTSTKPDVRINYSLDPEPGGTRLSFQFVMLTTGLMWILEPMISSSIRRQSAADFAKLKELLEG